MSLENLKLELSNISSFSLRTSYEVRRSSKQAAIGGAWIRV